ncbi:MAG: DUF2975 domain-containing protein [Oscillospiraceae bacterium]|nr:DUF2975 domain-containing protein [Oscillospiraceae bacterium]
MGSQKSTQTVAQVLRVMVSITFGCNLLVLPFVPVLVSLKGYGMPLSEVIGLAIGTPSERDLFAPEITLFFLLIGRWIENFDYSLVLCLFLLFCGVCTAVILWQARRVLDTILAGDTFTKANAQNMCRAAVCCFLIAGAALCRMVWGFFYYKSSAPLLTYNALFIPLFFMGGLLCMVMSALFRQAAALKDENDLTI